MSYYFQNLYIPHCNLFDSFVNSWPKHCSNPNIEWEKNKLMWGWWNKIFLIFECRHLDTLLLFVIFLYCLLQLSWKVRNLDSHHGHWEWKVCYSEFDITIMVCSLTECIKVLRFIPKFISNSFYLFSLFCMGILMSRLLLCPMTYILSLYNV